MNPINVQIDFSGLAQLIVNALVTGVENLLSPVPMNLEKWLFEQIQRLLSAEGGTNVLTHVPTELTTSSGDVLDLWRLVLPYQLGITAIVLCFQGYRVSQGRADIWDVVGRCAVLIALGQAVIPLAGLVFTVVNGAADRIIVSPLDIREQTMPNDVTIALELVIAAVLAVLAWIKGVVGVVFIKLLLVSAPVIFSLSALPIFEGLLQWWLKEFTTWTLRPFFVALVLRLGMSLGSEFGGPLQFMLAIVAFWMAWTMDSKIRSFSVGAWGSVAQWSLLSRGARMAAGAFGGGAGAATVAAASASSAATAGGTP